ncbi:MAG TPA: hypothetical protein VH477_13835 [Bryobacteraceae bacterium]
MLLVGLAGCGYVGPVLPPSPMLPQAVTDLTAVERGDQIVIRFSTPVRTTDNLGITEFSSIDLRLGVAGTPFDYDRWAATAARYDVEEPAGTDPDNPLSAVISKTIPARDWVGKRVAVAVRTAVRKNDHYSAWSNRVVLEVIPELAPPVVNTESTAKGVYLTWPSGGADVEYRIYRKSGSENAPLLLGTSKAAEFLDTSSQYETPYEYTVVAFKGSAESLSSQPVPITTVDKFAPSVPSGVTVLPAPNSIEVSWQRSPESDLKGYMVYRSVNDGPYQAMGGMLLVPAFSDRSAEHGKVYRYEISAIDQHNNESARSGPVQVNY